MKPETDLDRPLTVGEAIDLLGSMAAAITTCGSAVMSVHSGERDELIKYTREMLDHVKKFRVLYARLAGIELPEDGHE